MRHGRSAIAGTMSALLILGVIAGPAAAAGVTRYVDDDGLGSASGCAGATPIPTSIQAAVDASAPGDRVLVCAGTYVGSILVSTDGLVVSGVEPWTATVMPTATHPNNVPLIEVYGATGIKIRWLRLVAPTEQPCEDVGRMIRVSDAPNSQIRANNLGVSGPNGADQCGFRDGIHVDDDSNGTLVVWNTITDFVDSGIEIVDSTDVTVRGNAVRFFHAAVDETFFEGDGTVAIGIYLLGDGPGVRVLDNMIRSLKRGGQSSPRLAVGLRSDGVPALIRGNTFRDVIHAIELADVVGAQVVRNFARRDVDGGLRLTAATDGSVTENGFAGKSYGIEVSADSSNNQITDNEARGPGFDCRDESTGGAGTAGTSNVWTGNRGIEASPTGICSGPG